MESQTKNEMIFEIKKTLTKVYESLSELEDENTEKLCHEKCQAIKTFKNVQAQLACILQNEQNNEVLNILALVHFNCAILYADTAEPKAAEEELMKCIELLKGRESNDSCILLSLAARNQLGMMLQQRNEALKAQMFLEEAEEFYEDYQSACDSSVEPTYVAEIFGLSTKDLSTKEMLGKLYTDTLVQQILTSSDLSNHEGITSYSHMVLNRQFNSEEETLNTHIALNQRFNSQEEALKSTLVDAIINLAHVFLTEGDMTQARYHIAAVSYRLKLEHDSLRKKYPNPKENETATACWDFYYRKNVRVAKVWIAYAHKLLELSWNKKKEATENPDATATELVSSNFRNLKFDKFDKEIQSVAEQITDKYVVTFDDASTVFNQIQKWVEQVKKYYTLENSALCHMLANRDLSLAYGILQNFAADANTKAKLHKKRIDLNEYMLSQLNPKHYSSFCNSVRFEIAQTYMGLLCLKRDLWISDDRSPERIQKINRLSNAVLKHSKIFLNSIDNHKFGELTKLAGDIEYPALISYYHIGNAYSGMIPTTADLELQYLQKGIDAYRFFIDYSNKYTVEPETAKQENYHTIRQALDELLPLREMHLKLKLQKLC